jgi:hypothetical protein
MLLGQPLNCCLLLLLLLLLADGRSALLLLLLVAATLAPVTAAAAAAFGNARALKGRLNTSLADLDFAAAAAAVGLLAVLVFTAAGRSGFPCSPLGRAALTVLAGTALRPFTPAAMRGLVKHAASDPAGVAVLKLDDLIVPAAGVAAVRGLVKDGAVKDAETDPGGVDPALKLDDLALPVPGFAVVLDFPGPTAAALLLIELLLVDLTTAGLRCAAADVAAAPAAAVGLVGEGIFAAFVDFAAEGEMAGPPAQAAGFAAAFLLRCCSCRCILHSDASSAQINIILLWTYLVPVGRANSSQSEGVGRPGQHLLLYFCHSTVTKDRSTSRTLSYFQHHI